MPKEYIERGALLERMEKRLADLRTEFGSYDHYTDGFEEGCVAVEDADAADVVEVVRCQECKHAQHIDDKEPKYICTCPDVYGYGNRGAIFCRSTHYCGYGERKEDAE